MKSFDYTRKPIIVEAYGKNHTLPVKTTKFATKLAEILTAFKTVKDTTDIVTTLKSGIVLFIGQEEADRIYPSIDDTDVTEISSFWKFLIDAANGKETEIIENEYASNPEILK